VPDAAAALVDEAALRAAIGKLPPRMAAAVALRLQDRSDQEIAAVLGITVGGAKATLHKARTKLAGLVGDDDQERHDDP
jgi:DNA-directed RNA polymerase specialized sigma24 family protein